MTWQEQWLRWMTHRQMQYECEAAAKRFEAQIVKAFRRPYHHPQVYARKCGRQLAKRIIAACKELEHEK